MRNLLFSEASIRQLLDHPTIDPYLALSYLVGDQKSLPADIKLFMEWFERELIRNKKKSDSSLLSRKKKSPTPTHSIPSAAPITSQEEPKVIDLPDFLQDTVPETDVEISSKYLPLINQPDSCPFIYHRELESRLRSSQWFFEDDIDNNNVTEDEYNVAIAMHHQLRNEYIEGNRIPPRQKDNNPDYDLYYFTGEYQKFDLIRMYRESPKRRKYEVTDYEPVITEQKGYRDIMFEPTIFEPYRREFYLTEAHITGEEKHPHWDLFPDVVKYYDDQVPKHLKGKFRIAEINSHIASSSIEIDWHIKAYRERFDIPEFPTMEEIKALRSKKPEDHFNIIPVNGKNEAVYAYDIWHKDFFFTVINATDQCLEDMQIFFKKMTGHAYFEEFARTLNSIQNYHYDLRWWDDAGHASSGKLEVPPDMKSIDYDKFQENV